MDGLSRHGGPHASPIPWLPLKKLQGDDTPEGWRQWQLPLLKTLSRQIWGAPCLSNPMANSHNLRPTRVVRPLATGTVSRSKCPSICGTFIVGCIRLVLRGQGLVIVDEHRGVDVTQLPGPGSRAGSSCPGCRQRAHAGQTRSFLLLCI